MLTIPNGFDPADFDGPPPARDDSVFRIVHAGYLHTGPGGATTKLGRRILGGSERGLETSTRSACVPRFVQSTGCSSGGPTLRGAIRLDLVGAMSEADCAVAARIRRRRVGYLAHASTIELLRSADLLFLPMHDLAEGLRARIIPGKTYEYLRVEDARSSPPCPTATPASSSRPPATPTSAARPTSRR